jgi:hypothetical protein
VPGHNFEGSYADVADDLAKRRSGVKDHSGHHGSYPQVIRAPCGRIGLQAARSDFSDLSDIMQLRSDKFSGDPRPKTYPPANPFELNRGGYFALAFAFHSPSIAPVGSTMIESEPMSGTSVTSFITVAPRDFAFFVAASMSSTRT